MLSSHACDCTHEYDDNAPASPQGRAAMNKATLYFDAQRGRMTTKTAIRSSWMSTARMGSIPWVCGFAGLRHRPVLILLSSARADHGAHAAAGIRQAKRAELRKNLDRIVNQVVSKYDDLHYYQVCCMRAGACVTIRLKVYSRYRHAREYRITELRVAMLDLQIPLSKKCGGVIVRQRHGQARRHCMDWPTPVLRPICRRVSTTCAPCSSRS
jgi:hypothetical protein